MTKIKLNKPLQYKGQSISEIELNLEEMKGRDLIEIETQMNADGKFLVTDFSKAYQVKIAAKAAKIPAEELENLSARDFNKVTSAVQLFLVGSDSPGPAPTKPETETLPAKS